LAWSLCAAASAHPAEGSESTDEPAVDGSRGEHEWVVFPALGYDSDTGLGLGAMTAVARFGPGGHPYRWRLQAQAAVSLKWGGGLPVRVPTHDHYLRLEVPGLAAGRLRLRAEAMYQQQINMGYYGMGNGSLEARPWEGLDPGGPGEEHRAARRHNQYWRAYPSLRSDLWVRLPADLRAFFGLALRWNWLRVYPGSRLEADLAGDSGEAVRELLVGVQRHGVLEGTAGLMYDTRDDEHSPTRGMLHDLSVRGGPTLELPGGYGGLHLGLRFYLPVYPEYLVVAVRALGDLLVGRPPFYELSAHGGLFPGSGPGGGGSVRGVPLMRYHGKVKVLGNLELRSKFWWFRLLRKDSNLGVVAFFDAGRVWTELRPRVELDGRGAGVKYGVGGGLRLQMGATVVVRVDVGWSPDGLGIYFTLDHVF
jgi:hypothetical protein